MPYQSFWEKQLSNTSILVEYPIAVDEPSRSIVCGQAPKVISLLVFQRWGLDRETITGRQCSIVLQAVIEIGIVNEISEFTFEEALKVFSSCVVARIVGAASPLENR
jgi:hypothetical protein